MKYWLLKSEPNVWSIDQQIKTGSKGADWDGVRNYQAANNLRKMKNGDLCFFYHSNVGKEIVGIVEVIKTAFTDPSDKTNFIVDSIDPGFSRDKILIFSVISFKFILINLLFQFQKDLATIYQSQIIYLTCYYRLLHLKHQIFYYNFFY